MQMEGTSPPKEGTPGPELKAGHPPAQKVGGMRVVQKKAASSNEKEEPKMTQEEKEEFGEDKPLKVRVQIYLH